MWVGDLDGLDSVLVLLMVVLLGCFDRDHRGLDGTKLKIEQVRRGANRASTKIGDDLQGEPIFC